MLTAISRKQIEEMCGTASLKRGEAYNRAGKVKIEQMDSVQCEAVVAGTENFHVTVRCEETGSLETTCSCPTLPFYPHKCQHIAAVLLAIIEQTTDDGALSDGFLSLFNERPRSSGHQLHFENRKVLALTFTVQPVPVGRGKDMLGIAIQVDGHAIKNVGQFLKYVHEGRILQLSANCFYDPRSHCFTREADGILQQLIQGKQQSIELVKGSDIGTVTISPTTWDKLVPLFQSASCVNGLPFIKGNLPIQFSFGKREGKGHFLKIEGLQEVQVFQQYRTVMYANRLYLVQDEDCKRLADLQQMVQSSGTNNIPIANEQIGFFLEKVVPGLRKIGEVYLDETVKDELVQSPLQAKLYVDRVHNRLLASLEFHYDHLVINPLVDQQLPAGSMLVRDLEKEKTILQLMDEGAFAQTDEGYWLQNEELEYEFLHRILPKLQKLVRVYATTAIRNRVFRGNARPRIRVKTQEERTNWLEFKFTMDGIPDNQIRGILEALEEKRKYYRLKDGALLSLETKEFEEIQRFLNEVPGDLDALEKGLTVPVVQGLRFLDAAEDDGMITMEESARRFFERLRNPASLEIDVPQQLASVLRDYQKEGFKWLKTLASYGLGGVLADDMGLGKTVQSIAFIVSELAVIRKGSTPVLIVCPSSVTYNWLSELAKFAPDIQACVLDGSKKERVMRQREIGGQDVVITSYPLLRRDVQWFEKQHFHAVFFDEAQAFKNPYTQTARAVKKIVADHRFALTGTPIENSLEELWAIFHVVFPELFMGLREYSELSQKTIARRIRPFLLRRMKEDVLIELPGKIESMASSELLPEQKELYAAYLAKLRHDTLKHLDKDTIRKNKIRILAGLTRLRQICCHPALFVDGYAGSSAKFEQLKQLIEESKRAGRRVLIFSQFTKMLGIIGRDLAMNGTPFFYLDGETPADERLAFCNRFNAGERDLFLISLKAGGTGLNLTGADTVILYDLWWNPAVEEQAADRAHRIGQQQVVQVIKLVARGTIEEKMNELQEKKRNLIGEVIDADDSAINALTEEDIRELLRIDEGHIV
ncbi:DEAD/DEAH box helicase [Sporosarcina sp. OR05]